MRGSRRSRSRSRNRNRNQFFWCLVGRFVSICGGIRGLLDINQRLRGADVLSGIVEWHCVNCVNAIGIVCSAGASAVLSVCVWKLSLREGRKEEGEGTSGTRRARVGRATRSAGSTEINPPEMGKARAWSLSADTPCRWSSSREPGQNDFVSESQTGVASFRARSQDQKYFVQRYRPDRKNSRDASQDQ